MSHREVLSRPRNFFVPGEARQARSDDPEQTLPELERNLRAPSNWWNERVRCLKKPGTARTRTWTPSRCLLPSPRPAVYPLIHLSIHLSIRLPCPSKPNAKDDASPSSAGSLARAVVRDACGTAFVRSLPYVLAFHVVPSSVFILRSTQWTSRDSTTIHDHVEVSLASPSRNC